MSKSRFADPKSEVALKHLFESKENEELTHSFRQSYAQGQKSPI